MKKVWSVLLIIVLLLTAFSAEALAAQDAASFRFELSVDGLNEKEVKTGDVITVVLRLYRDDADENYTMYAMQNEIRYDSNFFELVEDSAILSDGIQSTDIAMRDDYREFYMNFLSLSGGETWSAKELIGSFQLRVIGSAGVTKITNQDYLVSLQDGSGSYPCAANELTIILSTDCTVHFESNGGTKIDDITAVYGEKIARPADPEREGKFFVGWFKDIDCTQAWDFDTDTASGNMTLYAKWSDTPVADADTDTAPTDDDDVRKNKNNYTWLWIALPVVFIAVVIVLILRKKKQ